MYELVGYAYSGYATCVEHKENNEEGSEILDSEETDRDILCDVCYDIGFKQGLNSENLRDMCLIQGKNIWYPQEIIDLAIAHLEEKIQDSPDDSEMKHYLSYCLLLLRSEKSINVFYSVINQLVIKLQTVEDALPEGVIDRITECYDEIQDSVRDHISFRTES